MTGLREGRHALDAGNPAAAQENVEAVLGLWRGPPLAEVAFEDFAQPEIRRLDELKLDALGCRIDADLQLDAELPGLVGELQALAARKPNQ